MKFIYLSIVCFTLIILQACGGTTDKQLISAAYNGKTEFLEKAIIDGADVNTVSEKENVSLLSYAAGAGHTDTVSMLLMHGAEIDKIDSSDWTALHFAASNGHHDTAKLLIDMSADMNITTSDGWTALMYAVFYNHAEVARSLVDHGADASIKTTEGLSAAEIASSKGFDHLLAVLE